MGRRPPAQSTVLYVEDEESDAFFMEMAFEKAGLAPALQRVGTGGQAIDYLSGKNDYRDRGRYPLPALVLLDLNLPVCSGFEVLQWVRAHPEFARLPVVIFSSSDRAEDKQRAGQLGASDYFEKPLSGSKFSDVVDQVNRSWLRADAPASRPGSPVSP